MVQILKTFSGEKRERSPIFLKSDIIFFPQCSPNLSTFKYVWGGFLTLVTCIYIQKLIVYFLIIFFTANSLKAPGPDGFGVCFYQQHWEVVGVEVRRVVLNFLNSGVFDNSINSTLIALIPKTSPTSVVTEFRPINLCNVLYKLIAKVLANRLKNVVPVIIS